MITQPQSRMTKQRALVLETLRGMKTHPTADEIYQRVREKMPKISLGTVYRNLDLLTNAGEIMLIERAGAQKRFDGEVRPHQHVRCIKCGAVADVHPPLPMVLPDVAGARIPGFCLYSIEVEITGACLACSQNETGKAKAS